jgi:endonuclease/exonuclease/phosphatase family metal-dependent hydrolase
MRVLSWNVRDLMGDPLAVHRVVRSIAPDVACLQETPRRPGARLRLRLLERGTGLRLVAGGRRGGGTALLVAPGVRVDWATTVRLPVTGLLTRTRGACVADCIVAGVAVTVASVHLPLVAEQRLDHARRVARMVRWRGLSAVVAGDLNEPAGAPAWQVWEPLAGDPCPDAAPTYPAHGPVHRLDAVLTGTSLRVDAYGDGGADPTDVRLASDHVPVVADLSPTPS